MTVIVSLCAFLLALLGSRIIILAMRQRRNQLGYDKLPPGTPGALPLSIQDGGIVVVFAALICLSVMDMRYAVLLSVLMLAAMSMLKKLLPVPWVVQMLVQILAISLPMSVYTEPTFGGLFAPWVDILITGALWLLFIQAFASMDGLDGLCASGMVSIGMGLAIIATLAGKFPDMLSNYSLITAAAACGFFWWNHPPAKISMGEVGTIPAGFLLAYLLFIAARQGYGYSALILPAYFIMDYGLSWLKRTWKSQPMKRSHSDYYYLLALKNGRRPRFVLRSVMGMNLLAIFLAAHAQIEPALALFHFFLAYLSVFMLLGFFVNRGKGAGQ